MKQFEIVLSQNPPLTRERESAISIFNGDTDRLEFKFEAIEITVILIHTCKQCAISLSNGDVQKANPALALTLMAALRNFPEGLSNDSTREISVEKKGLP
ncbi:unnamed protein product [Prunus armeniaca]|uniref:Uncharacterized protein n=1 Tax=Prunus armeniaca TaxID=36596 RepID=A0A6J5UVT6_PRUAR|nr:unnamed protein product [Prunus armeniaca]CAB4311084.1 unnamed protein product [Prunus armeniaca]